MKWSRLFLITIFLMVISACSTGITPTSTSTPQPTNTPTPTPFPPFTGKSSDFGELGNIKRTQPNDTLPR